MLGSKHSVSGWPEFKQSIQYSKNSIIDKKEVYKDADKLFSIFIKIPTGTGSIDLLVGTFDSHF